MQISWNYFLIAMKTILDSYLRKWLFYTFTAICWWEELDDDIFWWGLCCSSFCFFFFVCVELCVFTFWVSGCDVRYYFRIKTIFGSSFPPVVCRGAHVLFTNSGVQHIMRCVFVLFFFVLCTLCCQFPWIVHFWLLLRYSLTLSLIRTYTYVLITDSSTCCKC